MKWRHLLLLGGGLLLSSGLLAQPQRLAVVVGNNHPLPDSDYDTLQYADDDAIRFARFFRGIDAQVFLLTTPDSDTVKRFGQLPVKAKRPSRENLTAVLQQLQRLLLEKAGQQTEVFFYFSGHGSVTAANAYLHLADGKFTRSDLYNQVVQPLEVDRLHIIIDSCHSYFLVNPRGERLPATEEANQLQHFPAAGFLLSTSKRKEVHEWSGYKAGVFSYQLLGAMMGAADLDNNGQVTYGETHAYLAAANSKIVDERARIEPFVHYPNLATRVLVDLEPARLCVTVPKDMRGHFYIADARGNRLLDANKADGYPLHLALPKKSEYFLQHSSQSYLAPCQEATVVAFAPVGAEVNGDAATRGTVTDAFRRDLFQTTLTRDFAAGFGLGVDNRVAVTQPEQQQVSWYQDSATLAIFGAAGVFLTAGAALTVPFVLTVDEANTRPVTARTETARAEAENWRAAMMLAYGAGGALLVVAVGAATLSLMQDAEEQ